ncbi:MAG: hypothetical protein OXR66_09510 [Candidatus Woesearchaeota archaeon]|nr:hypothetical protein [Candidatus Woesearchaeota archaeon]
MGKGGEAIGVIIVIILIILLLWWLGSAATSNSPPISSTAGKTCVENGGRCMERCPGNFLPTNYPCAYPTDYCCLPVE